MYFLVGLVILDSLDGWIFLIVWYYFVDFFLFVNVVVYSCMSFWFYLRYNVLMFILMVVCF